MSRQRYEPVSQRDEVIILDSIHNSPNYNYNSAIPNSVPSSTAPSVISTTTSSTTLSRNTTPVPIYSGGVGGPPPPFSPSSPPPSFHTISSPGTPRPSRSIRTSHSNPSYAELWGVAASTVGGAMTETETELGTEGGRGIGTSNDALATIAGLRTRVEWLEESIGRLLIEKDAYTNQNRNTPPSDGGESSSSSNPHSNPNHRSKRNNCCVTFSSTTPDLERAIANGGRNNCCVTFRSAEQVEKGAHAIAAVRLVLLALVVMFLTLAISGRGGGGGGRDNIRIGGANGERVNGMGVGIEKTTEVVTTSGVDLD